MEPPGIAPGSDPLIARGFIAIVFGANPGDRPNIGAKRLRGKDWFQGGGGAGPPGLENLEFHRASSRCEAESRNWRQGDPAPKSSVARGGRIAVSMSGMTADEILFRSS